MDLQVRAGEIVTSARAIDEPTMKTIYNYNITFTKDVGGLGVRKRKREDPTLWAGQNIRTMLNFLYVVSFLCLLRYDEALRIRWDDISYGEDEHGELFTELKLPFRKTHQNGGKQHPFYSRCRLLMLFCRDSPFHAVRGQETASSLRCWSICCLDSDDG